MIGKKYSVSLAILLMSPASGAFAQKTKRAKKQVPVKVETVVEEQQEIQEYADSVVMPEPQDRLDTIYYNKNWKVCRNKAFANYYRLALYPVDTTMSKEFRTYYMSGELQGEGAFVTLDKEDDAKSVFSGSITTYYKNGKPEELKTYKDGKLDNEYTSFYANGFVREHFFLNNGMKEGVMAAFTEDGRACTLTLYHDDAPEGLCCRGCGWQLLEVFLDGQTTYLGNTVAR